MRIIRIFFLFALLTCMTGCNSGRPAPDADVYVSDKTTRSELMQMGVKEYREVFRDLSPEIKYKIWSMKIQDVIDHWELKGEELEIGLRIQEKMSPEMFEEEKPYSYILSSEIYDRLMQEGDSSVQVRLMLAYEMPQTLNELKTLIRRVDYAVIRSECEKDPHMKRLLGL